MTRDELYNAMLKSKEVLYKNERCTVFSVQKKRTTLDQIYGYITHFVSNKKYNQIKRIPKK